MKLIICCLIILISLNASLADRFPRYSQSCPQGSFLGRFWDGQKCEICSYRQCYCSSYLGCDSCKEQYSLATPTSYIKTCLPCGPDMNGGLNLADGVKNCCFMEEGPDNLDPRSPFQININGVNLKTRPMRATQCYKQGDTGNPNNNYYQMFGSICYSQPGCLNFTEYGKCSLCQQGYFMSYQSTCTACTVTNCQVCLADLQCSTCTIGYYMASNDGKPTADADVIAGASLCKKCSDFCSCSGIYDSKLQAQRLCEGCISNSYWFKSDGAGLCTACSTSMANCIQCTSDKKCQVCQQGYVLNADQSACVQCPDNCYKCSFLNDKAKTTCASDGCHNGYFYEQTSDGLGICPACSLQYTTRCDGKNGQTITQCGDQLTDPTYTDPPHSTQKYLINTPTGGQKCIPNSNNCKKMIDKPQTAQEGQCDSCYEDLGQYLAKKSKICLNCQTVRPNCVSTKCSPNESDSLDCTQCISGVQPSKYKDPNAGNYYLTSQKGCVSCPFGCLSCKDGTTCDGCQESFLLSSGSCAQCGVVNCKDCSGGINRCSKCYPSFKVYTNYDGLNNDLCISCDDPQCLDCSSDRKTCTQCQSGYYVAGKVCMPTRTNCVQYRPSEGTCSVCQYGFRPVDGWCVRCLSTDQGYINCQSTSDQCAELKKYRRDGDQYNLAWEQKIYPPTNNSLSMLKAGLLIVISMILMFII